MSASFFYPRSFQQLLLVGFLLIATLLGGGLVDAVFSFESLMAQSQQGTNQAVRLSAMLQTLLHQTETMERVSRQYLLLREPALLRTYLIPAHTAEQTARLLSTQAQPIELSRKLAQWQQTSSTVTAGLTDGSALTGAGSEALSRNFALLHQLNDQLQEGYAQLMASQLDQMRRRMVAQRAAMSWMVAGVLLLAVTMAVGFGWWINRPIRQLEGAIHRLGEYELGNPITILGPADLTRIGERLDWLRQRLLDLEAEKSRFLRHMSHELKTPLTAIREGAELLVDEVAGTLAPAQRQVARILRQSSLTLQRQIESLLDYSKTRVSVGDLHAQPCMINEVLDRVVQAQGLHLQARRIQLDSHIEPIKLVGDEAKLRAVFDNLLSNAIKFSPVGGQVRVRLKQLGDCMQFDCFDRGPGVADHERHRIFEPFYQGENQPQTYVHGSGIGLSIARDYVEMHGGSIAVLDREDGPGICFRVWIPCTVGRLM